MSVKCMQCVYTHTHTYIYTHQFSSVQSLSHVWLFATPWTAAHKASLSITNSQSLLNLMSIELVMPSNNLILCDLLLLPSIFSRIRVFSNESVLCIRWPKYWVSASASLLLRNVQDWFPLGWIVGSPCSPRDSQESSPTPQKICFFPYLELNHQFGSLQILTICIKRKLG